MQEVGPRWRCRVCRLGHPHSPNSDDSYRPNVPGTLTGASWPIQCSLVAAWIRRRCSHGLRRPRSGRPGRGVGAVDPAGSDSPLLIADHCLAVYPCSIASLYIRVSRRCRCVRTSPSSVTATQRSVLVGQGPTARHIRSAWSMRSVTTLHKYEQQRYRSRTLRLQPSLAHLRLRLGLGLGVSMGSPGVVRGVHPKTSSRLLVSTLNRRAYDDCDGRGLTTKSAKSLLAEP